MRNHRLCCCCHLLFCHIFTFQQEICPTSTQTLRFVTGPGPLGTGRRPKLGLQVSDVQQEGPVLLVGGVTGRDFVHDAQGGVQAAQE